MASCPRPPSLNTVAAEGERARLEQLLDYLREGPRGARIDGLDVTWGQPSGRHTTFGVAH